MDLDWQDQAACAGLDTEDFYDTHAQPVVMKVCAVCPVQTECRNFAIDTGEEHGVWGGTSVRARRRLGMVHVNVGWDWVALLRARQEREARCAEAV